LIAIDTSVAVAAFASWHEAHAASSAVLARRPRLPFHVLLETFSVLTRLPPPHRVPANVAREFLAQRFPAALLVLPAQEQRGLIDLAVRAGFSGGAIYDALVAATALHSNAVLVTRDRRAVIVYDAVGVRFELLP
jgi:predicted nucleic acid-binding protein